MAESPDMPSRHHRTVVRLLWLGAVHVLRLLLELLNLLPEIDSLETKSRAAACFTFLWPGMPHFHRIGPLGRFGLVVAMSVRPSLNLSCPLPMQFFLSPLIGPQIT